MITGVFNQSKVGLQLLFKARFVTEEDLERTMMWLLSQ